MALNAQQTAFALAFLKEPNATRAAIRAGYSAKTAYAAGSRMLKHPGIKALIDSTLAGDPVVVEQPKQPEKRVSTHRIVELENRWAEEMNRLAFHQRPKDRFRYDHKIKALDLIGKAEGRYSDSTAVNSGLQININLGVFNKVEVDDE